MHNVVEALRKLVSFNTVSENSNLELVEFLRDQCLEHDFPCTVMPSKDGSKANFLATFGPNVPGGILLSGHSDVVTIEGQKWSSPPFQLVERGEKLFGRGTCDMKGFLAVILGNLPALGRARLTRPIHLAVSFDEEVGCLGAPSLIKEIKRLLPPISTVVVGEPTGMEVAVAHKGVTVGHVHVVGVQAHSSQTHLGISANAFAARFIVLLDNLSCKLSEEKNQKLRLAPKHSTINVGIVQGGMNPYTISDHCSFSWDLRVIPGESAAPLIQRISNYAASLEAEMKQFFESASIRMNVHSVPGLDANLNSHATQVCQRWRNTSNSIDVSYGTEAGLFQEAGFSTVICGPGSIEQAHKPDEFITIQQLQSCHEFFHRITDNLST
ncbi:acetylornithine deacetylase [Rhodobacteraceae bacterium]|nr:acetylornithine deacetylase [Paracoccaceae bacterium]